MDTIQNIIAEVFAIEDTGSQIKLKDKTKHSVGSFFKDKKDGTPSQAWQQFQNMGIKSGSVVEIGFKENPDKNDPKIVYKNIIGFREAAGRPQSPQTPKSAPQQQIKYEADNSPDWDNIAVGKCQTVFLQAYIQAGHSFSEAKLQAVQARQLAELVVHGQQKTEENRRTPSEPPLGEAPPEIDENNPPF